MATVTPTITYAPNGYRDLVQVVWAGLATGDDGAPVDIANWQDRSVQAEGTFGGATVGVQGSNDGTNYRSLSDAASTAIAITAAGIEQVLEIVRLVRPIVTGGAGSGLTVTLLAKRN